MADKPQKLDFKNEKVRKALYKEIGEGFYDRPIKIKQWNKKRKALEEFLKENKTLPEDNPPLYKECQDLLTRLQWYSFFNLISNEVINLFNSGIHVALSEKTFPLETYLSIFLLNIPSLGLRDEYKTKIRQAVLGSKKKITSGDVKTVADWLKLYNQELGADEVEKFRVAEFLNKNKHIVKLSSFEKIKIKRLFELYEELKIPANTIEGLEEEVYVLNEQGELELHKRGEVENITRAVEKGQAKRVAEEAQKEPPPLPSLDLKTAIKNAIEGAGIKFSDKALQKRFENIAKSYFGDMRSEIETRIVLKRDTKVGGMGFNDESADKVINIFKKEKPQVEIKESELKDEEKKASLVAELAKGLKPPEELISVETRMAPSPLLKIEEEKKEQKKEPAPVSHEIKEDTKKSAISKEMPMSEKKFIEPEKPQETPKPEAKPVLTPEPQRVPEPAALKPDKAEVKPKEDIEIKKPVEKKTPAPSPSKPIVEEIKVKPRVYGPADELRTLSLTDWRRWGATEQAVGKILDKINLLAEESLIKKAEAIKAWKESEINRLYLEIGEESINEGKSVEQVIKTRQQQRKSTLTQEEFDAVVGLNQKLRF